MHQADSYSPYSEPSPANSLRTLQQLQQEEHRFFFSTYKRIPLVIERGEGAELVAADGTRYLDFFGGLAVNALGYGNSAVLDAIKSQAEKYLHLSNLYYAPSQVELAKLILEATGYKRIFFSNSGTEAIEGVIKLARKWGKPKNKKMIWGLSHSFHGRTMGALSLTERPKYRQDYEPFLEGTGHLEFNSVADLEAHVNEETLAVILEPIQGEGGIHEVSAEYAQALKSFRDRFGFLIIADEIQSGMGRTGRFLASEHLNLGPDIVVIAKALGGGLPLGAFLGNERVADVFTFGAHGTTFGGNPVACAAGCAVMTELFQGKLIERAGTTGEYLKSGVERLQKEFPQYIKEIRGRGCMLGIDLTIEGQPIVDDLFGEHILINCTSVTVLRLLPSYIVSESQCDKFLSGLRGALVRMGEGSGR